MAEPYDLPHIDISSRRIARPFQAPRENRGGGGAPRIREEHGKRLQNELAAALAGADRRASAIEALEPAPGRYIEVELSRRKKPDQLERKRDNVRPGAVRLESNEAVTVALHVPDAARSVLESIIRDYTEGDLLESGNAPHKDFVEPIEAIREARLQTFWTDTLDALPQNAEDTIWWEVWCFGGFAYAVAENASRLGATIAERHYWLQFPEFNVVPIYTSRVTIELLLFATFGIAELRRASATPVFFTEENRVDQYQWAQNLAERITWPGTDVPAICLFDTGVNRAHVLIEPALSTADAQAIQSVWGADDHEGHGTKMAGLALHGDLTPRLFDESSYVLVHRVESVKILPPTAFPANDPKSYGAITQSGVSLAEITKPDRRRLFCMAVTNENVSGSRPTTWSAAIDQIAAGVMPGDEDDAPRRLFIVSGGNIPPHTEFARIRSPDDYPIEDPAQAWNALTVGGYTNKVEIDEVGLEGWLPLAAAGDLSPFSRTSTTWPQGKAPFKPDIVMEAGNRAVSPEERDVLTTDSLSLLTTGADTDRQPLTPFEATSAAAAQAARLAAQLMAEFPMYWPETVRALIVHSAEWTSEMRRQLTAVSGLRDRYALLRRFGYGVPMAERARASAQNDLALVAQNHIQPFKLEGGQRRFAQCHFYRLPWPRQVLEDLGEAEVRLKITLSYFVEPNPGRSASIDPQYYQSFGLRFDLKRPLEDSEDFIRRVNALERENPLGSTRVVADDNRWVFGPQSISAGSLHCDEWKGPAAQLAARDMLCIRPVIGWWRNRASAEVCNRHGRYALIVTLSTDATDVELHSQISAIVDAEVDVEIVG